MEPHIDMAEFERLQPEILKGFATAREFAKEGTWMEPGFTFEDMSYRPNWKPIYEAMKELMALPDDNPIKQAGMKDYRDWETDRKSTRLNSSHSRASRMPSSA